MSHFCSTRVTILLRFALLLLVDLPRPTAAHRTAQSKAAQRPQLTTLHTTTHGTSAQAPEYCILYRKMYSGLYYRLYRTARTCP